MRNSSRPYTVVASSKDRDDWLAKRKTMLTASDVHKVLHGTKSEYEKLLAIKRGEKESPYLMRIKPVAAGTFGEDGIRKLWCHLERRRARATPLLCRSNKYPFLGATPDGVVWDSLEGHVGCLEIKLVTTCDVGKDGYLRSEYTAKALAKWRGGPPVHYCTQHDTQMFVCGYDYGYIVAGFAFSNPVGYYRAFGDKRRRAYEKDVIPRLEDFARKARLI